MDWLIWHVVLPLYLLAHPPAIGQPVEVPPDYRACETCLTEREQWSRTPIDVLTAGTAVSAAK